MNKTVSVNISGFIFNIEDSAYDKLNRYLNTIRGYFSESTGAEEIIEDIEARIAELFQEKISENYQVIKLKDVNEVINTMGQPEAYIDPEMESEESSQQTYSSEEQGSSYAQSEPRNRYRKIYRDGDDKVLGGVCSGIGHYFGIDPIWIRLFFLVLLIGFGTGVLLYIILWIIIPKAGTPSEKLEMKGDPVTAQNIGRQVEEEIGNLKKKYKDYTSKDRPKDPKAQSGVQQFFSFLGNLLQLLFSSLGKVFGFLFILLGLFVIASLIFNLGTAGEFLTLYVDHDGTWTLNQSEVLALLPERLLNNSWLGIMSLILVGIPFLYLLIIGVNLLTDNSFKVRGLGVGLFIVWFIALIMAFFYSTTVIGDYRNEYSNKDVIQLEQVTGDTLTIEVMEDDIYFMDRSHSFHDELDYIKVTDDRIYIGNPELDVEMSSTDQFQLIIYKEARGRNRELARENFQKLEYEYMEMGNLISFSPYFSIPRENGYHFEELRMTLLVPEGKAIYFQDGSERVIYDVDNVTNTYDLDMIDKVWTMTEDGLECIGCDPDEI